MKFSSDFEKSLDFIKINFKKIHSQKNIRKNQQIFLFFCFKKFEFYSC